MKDFQSVPRGKQTWFRSSIFGICQKWVFPKPIELFIGYTKYPIQLFYMGSTKHQKRIKMKRSALKMRHFGAFY